MKRKFGGAILLLFTLVCVMGADTVSFNAGQPTPNPGGKASMISADGTYTLDPGHSFKGLSLVAESGGVGSSYAGGQGANGNWTFPATGIAAGTYDCWV